MYCESFGVNCFMVHRDVLRAAGCPCEHGSDAGTEEALLTVLQRLAPPTVFRARQLRAAWPSSHAVGQWDEEGTAAACTGVAIGDVLPPGLEAWPEVICRAPLGAWELV